MILTLGIAYWTVSILAAVFLLVCVVMMLTVLIQRPQGGGLSGAFGSGGGGGAGQTAFGTKTGDALTIATIAMFIIFLGLAVGLNFATRPENIGTQPAAVLVPGEGGSGDPTTTGTTQVDDEVGDEGASEPDAGATGEEGTPSIVDEMVEQGEEALDDAAGAVEDAVDEVEGAVDDALGTEGDEPGEDG